MHASGPDYGGRIVLVDGAIGPAIEGSAEPFKLEISETIDKPIVFGFIYSISLVPPVSWGLLMLFRRQHIRAFTSSATDWHSFAVTQPGKAASNARFGGFRPVRSSQTRCLGRWRSRDAGKRCL